MLQANSRGSKSSIKNNPQFHFPHPAEGTIALTAKGESLLDTPPKEFAGHGAVFCINQSVLVVPRNYVTAFSFRDKDKPELWGNLPWPKDIPMLSFSDVASKRARANNVPVYSSALVLAQLLHFFPDREIHLYGFDYEDTPAILTNVKFSQKRLAPELGVLSGIWLPEQHRIVNHGALTTERLKTYMVPTDSR